METACTGSKCRSASPWRRSLSTADVRKRCVRAWPRNCDGRSGLGRHVRCSGGGCGCARVICSAAARVHAFGVGAGVCVCVCACVCVCLCWCRAGSSEGCLQALSRAENLKEEVDEELGIAVICREIFLQQVDVLGA